MLKLTALVFIVVTLSPAQETVKCLTPEIVRRHISARMNKTELAATTRPVSQTNILSPSGHFRIHFDTTGANQPAMILMDGSRIPNSYPAYVDTAAKILDMVWKTEIDSFGFTPPPPDNGKGGGNELDVYIHNLGTGVFGYTEWDDDNSIVPGKINPQYSTFIHIDKDYGAGYRTKGMPALLATCAHEFHHTLQIGNSGIWFDDFYFYEICAESMEPTVFPVARDYLLDIGTFYQNTNNVPLFLPQENQYQGYERAIFGIFFMRRYGPHFMQDVWNEIRTARPIPALQNAFILKSSTLKREYSEFGEWNYYTGARADGLKYFPDAGLFPVLNFSRDDRITAQITMTQSLQSFTTTYIQALNGGDSVHLIVQNDNYDDAVNYRQQSFPFVLTLSPVSFGGSTQVSPSIYYSLSIDDISNWNLLSISNNFVSIKGTAGVFPNPFDPFASILLISIDHPSGGSPQLSIFSPSMDLIYNRPSPVKLYLGKQFVEWNGKDNKGKVVGNGVYIYVISDGSSSVQKGKFAVRR